MCRFEKACSKVGFWDITFRPISKIHLPETCQRAGIPKYF